MQKEGGLEVEAVCFFDTLVPSCESAQQRNAEHLHIETI